MTLARFERPSLPVMVAKPRSGVWRIVREIALLAMLFGFYNLGRFLAADHVGAAYVHADELIRWETWFGLPSEATVQQPALRVPGLADVANVFYASVHFPLTAAVLVWLMIRRPAEYGKARWALACLTGLALIGHMSFPLAPPRMMPGWVDTGVILGQSVYGPTTDSGVANQFAAMPSLHVGWAFMVAVILIRATRSGWRWLWIAHPAITFAVVVVTANHYWLDGLVAIALALPLLLIFDARRPSSLVRTGPAATTLVGCTGGEMVADGNLVGSRRADREPAVASSSSALTPSPTTASIGLCSCSRRASGGGRGCSRARTPVIWWRHGRSGKTGPHGTRSGAPRARSPSGQGSWRRECCAGHPR